jgi:hypothetical protein
MMELINMALVSVYLSFGSSADRIASSATLRSEFKNRLPNEFQNLEDDELVSRLLNLRK